MLCSCDKVGIEYSRTWVSALEGERSEALQPYATRSEPSGHALHAVPAAQRAWYTATSSSTTCRCACRACCARCARCVQGVVHRDLKLDNLLLDKAVPDEALCNLDKLLERRPQVKLCDFGTSKVSAVLSHAVHMLRHAKRPPRQCHVVPRCVMPCHAERCCARGLANAAPGGAF